MCMSPSLYKRYLVCLPSKTDVPSIKVIHLCLICPPIKSMSIRVCALGNFLHTEKRKRRRRRLNFIHQTHKKNNWDLHIFPHNILITLIRVLLRLCIGAPFSGLISRPPQGLFHACRPCHLEEKSRVRSSTQPHQLSLNNWRWISMN